MPGAAYIVSIMSSISVWSSSPKSTTGAAGACRPCAPYFTRGRSMTCSLASSGRETRADALHPAPPGRLDFADGVGAEFLEDGVGQHEAHHRFPDDRRRRHRADVAAFDRGG